MTIGYLLDNFWVAPPLEERVITRESTPDAKTIKPMHERCKRAKHHVSLRVYLCMLFQDVSTLLYVAIGIRISASTPVTPRASHFSQPPRGIDESMKMVIGSKSELSDLWTRPGDFQNRNEGKPPPGKHLPVQIGKMSFLSN